MAFRRNSSAVEDDGGLENAGINIDGLTGLPDRWQFEAMVTRQLGRSRRTGDRFGVYLITVRNLVDINHGYGSAVGDEVLQAVGEALQTAVGTRGEVARYLGSEFAILWPGLFGQEEARRAAINICSQLPQQISFENFIVPIKVSTAGVISETDTNERLLLVDAEATLAEARAAGPSAVVIREESYTLSHKPEVLSVRLQRAFENEEFQLYYQPVVSLSAGTLVGFEAVLRWLSPDAGPAGAELIAPGAFLEALRSSPIVVPLHAWILNEATRRVGYWNRRLQPASLFVAANLDSTFVRDQRFAEVVMKAVEDAGVRPSQLLLDVNGHTAGPQLNMLWPVLQQVKAQGVGIALEDFGVGYSSPDLLRRCRFDVIRLPRVLVGGLGLADEDRIILASLVQMGHDLGCAVIAEGVETEVQARMLKEMKCDLAQGFYFGRPAPENEVDRDLDDYILLARNAGKLS